MEWGWLQSLLFGVISGFAEFLPVSSDAHQLLFAKLTGAGDEQLGFRLICRIFVLLALLLSCRPQLARLMREQRIASSARKRRKRQPDVRSILDLRIIKTASVPLLLSFILYIPAQNAAGGMVTVAIFLALNGLILYLPRFFSSGNKESQAMSALDSIILGLSGSLSVLPGISRMGALVSVGRLRGCDSRYAADIALLLSIPALCILVGFDIYAVFAAASTMSFRLLLSYILAAIATFISAYFGILFVRFLAVKVGVSGFAYYCWGMSLFVFVLYLLI